MTISNFGIHPVESMSTYRPCPDLIRATAEKEWSVYPFSHREFFTDLNADPFSVHISCCRWCCDVTLCRVMHRSIQHSRRHRISKQLNGEQHRRQTKTQNNGDVFIRNVEHDSSPPSCGLYVEISNAFLGTKDECVISQNCKSLFKHGTN